MIIIIGVMRNLSRKSLTGILQVHSIQGEK